MTGILDPITAEIIVSGLLYASEEMGIAVRNAAYSPNIKERLDHSCALFDAQLRLVAQAEHIPVHLGSLPWVCAARSNASRRLVTRCAPGEICGWSIRSLPFGHAFSTTSR